MVKQGHLYHRYNRFRHRIRDFALRNLPFKEVQQSVKGIIFALVAVSNNSANIWEYRTRSGIYI